MWWEGMKLCTSAQNRHHDMFGDGMAVAVGDFGDGDVVLDRGLQVGVVRANAGRHNHLELFRLREALGGHVGRPERLRDDDFRVGSSLSSTLSAPSLLEVTTS